MSAIQYRCEVDVIRELIKTRVSRVIVGVSAAVSGWEAALALPSPGPVMVVGKDGADRRGERLVRPFRVAQLLNKVSDAVTTFVETTAANGAEGKSSEVILARTQLDTSVKKLLAEVRKLSDGEKQTLVEEVLKLQEATGKELDTILKSCEELKRRLPNATRKEVEELRKSLKTCDATLNVVRSILEAAKP